MSSLPRTQALPCPQALAADSPRRRFTARQLMRQIWRKIRLHSDLARSRRHLGALDDHLLKDIGIDALSAKAEAKRSLWHAPPHWIDPK